MKYDPGSCYRELFKRYEANPILTVRDWPYPINSVFNPGATMVNGRYLLLVRVEDRRGISHLCAARSANGVTGWEIDRLPAFWPEPGENPVETWGIESRITWIEELGLWVVAYTAYSEVGRLVALASTKDFVNFQRHGPAMPPEDKDAALFPVKFKGRYAIYIDLNRLFPGPWESTSDIFFA